MNLTLPRAKDARPFVGPALNSPSARRLERPLADVLDDNAANPLRRKFVPTSRQQLTINDFKLPLLEQCLAEPSVAAGNPGFSTDVPDPSNACMTPGTQNNQVRSKSILKLQDDVEKKSRVPFRYSRCYAFVPTPPTQQAATAIQEAPSSKRRVSFEGFMPTKHGASDEKESKWGDERLQDLQRIKDLEDRLEALESSKVAELNAIRVSVKAKKQELDDEIRATELQQTNDDKKLSENRRIIDCLKGENDKIRALNHDLLKSVQTLRKNNMKLEEWLADTVQLERKLASYHESAMQTNEKLQKKIRQLERSLTDVRYQVEEVADYAFCERAFRGVYEQAIIGLPRRFDQQGDHDLSHQVLELVASGTINPIQRAEVDAASATATEA
jgi:hypothetical protein